MQWSIIDVLVIQWANAQRPNTDIDQLSISLLLNAPLEADVARNQFFVHDYDTDIVECKG